MLQLMNWLIVPFMLIWTICFDFPNWYEFTPCDREYPKVVGPLFNKLDDDELGE